VVIRNLYITSVPFAPNKADAILIVDANAVLPGPIPAQRLQLISRRHFQVIERNGRIQNRQLVESSAPQIRRKSSAFPRLPQSLGFLIPETQNHIRILTHYGTTVKR
jgi:hypothetical protein